MRRRPTRVDAEAGFLVTARRRFVEERGGRWRSWTAVVLRWWNWRLAVKLVAVLVVPVLAVVVLGAWLVGSELARANSYARVDGLVSVQVSAQALLNDLQDERTMSGQFLSGTGVDDPAALVRQSHKVDASLAAAERGLAASRDSGLGQRFAAVSEQLRSLHPLRRSVQERITSAVTAQTQYTAVVSTLLRFDQALVSRIADPALSSGATALYNLALADEQCALQHAVVAAGIGRGQLLPVEAQALRATLVRWDDRMADFRAVASPHQIQAHAEAMNGADVGTQHGLLRTALEQGPALRIDAQEWNRVSAGVRDMHRGMQTSGLNHLRAASSGLQDTSSNLAGAEAVILVSLLGLAAIVLAVIGRNLAASLGTLRRTALEVANCRLPSAVAKIRDGKGNSTIEPVAVHTTEEVGQLARAVDTLHSEAVRLAVEQAELRQNLNTTFVNVSRRSQSMVEHLLRELERLERNEEDPEQLSSLFRLDHLATRMRRNNENLVVLSGNDLSRRFTQALPLGDVLRAAVSEIEQYERVVVRPTPAVWIAGYAVGDLVRLIAELLDNAAQCSSPDTRVTITGQRARDGRLVVEVADRGIGMSRADLADANARLTEAASVDAAVSRQMGFFVVGLLARKHDIHVRLRGGGQGVTAVVTVPEALLTSQPGEDRAGAPGTAGVNGAAVPDQRMWGSELPSREPGSTRSRTGPRRRSGEIRPLFSDSRTHLAEPMTPVNEPTADENGSTPRETTRSGHSGPGTRPASPDGIGWFDNAPPFEEDEDRSTQQDPARSAETGPRGPGSIVARTSSWLDGWKAARDAAGSEPTARTSAGLPKRKPRENLLPGSAQPSGPSEPVRRAPEDLRRRIARFQAGTHDAHSDSPRRTEHRSSGPEGRTGE